jgi:hypothetical protein
LIHAGAVKGLQLEDAAPDTGTDAPEPHVSVVGSSAVDGRLTGDVMRASAQEYLGDCYAPLGTFEFYAHQDIVG